MPEFEMCSKMCSECPFLKGAPRWLGGHTAEDIMELYRYDVSFPCHKTTHNLETNERGAFTSGKTHEAIMRGDAKLCRGYAIMMKKSAKLPRSPELAKAVESVEEDEKVMTIFEFLEHHKEIPNGNV